ncbi:hypothetical protein [Streptomyces longisporoflavus]|uniref:Integral membrane protein n=1 Tax=Streptomyces longisporoflavus TaxID=28044 RepID=A0ABW7QV58_9ACTN
MAPKTQHLVSPRALRQLRRTRGFYLAGALFWAVAAAWTGWTAPGSRQMWISLFLAAAFTGLLGAASLWLHRLQTTAECRPTRPASSRGTVTQGHASA